MSLVLVTGAAASGKSTLASVLAPRLGIPLLAKDTLKDALVATLGAPDLEESRRLGRAAAAALLSVAAEAGSAVVEGVWVDSAAATGALGQAGVGVELHCACPLPELRRRYAARAASRPPGGFDLERVDDELWSADLLRPLAGGWPVVEVDTSGTVDVDALADRIRRTAP